MRSSDFRDEGDDIDESDTSGDTSGFAVQTALLEKNSGDKGEIETISLDELIDML